MKTHFHVIYLAAGYSRRFFGNKLLAPLNGKSLYRHTLDRLLEIRREAHGAVDITVVTQYEAIREAMDALIDSALSAGGLDNITAILVQNCDEVNE